MRVTVVRAWNPLYLSKEISYRHYCGKDGTLYATLIVVAGFLNRNRPDTLGENHAARGGKKR